MTEWVRAARAALRPSDASWAIGPAIALVLAVGVVAVGGALTHRYVGVGLIFFGAACSVAFVSWGPYRLRAISLVAQAIGAVFGLWIGSLPDSDPGRIGVAVAVALVSGLIGGFGRPATAAGLMAVIGVAFAEFGHADISWDRQAFLYLVGAALVGLISLGFWPLRRDRPEREAVAGVLMESARVFETADTSDAAAARAALTTASTAAREAVHAGRFQLSAADERYVAVELARAQAIAFEAAAAHVDQRADLAHAAEARRAADLVRQGKPTAGADRDEVPVVASRPVQQGFSGYPWTAAFVAGARLALCIGIATAVSASLHGESHSYWIPLTVAVIVRPEYASIFVRTVNRLAGTIAGAVVAALVLVVASHGMPVAIGAALAIGFAVAAAPRLYALTVVGITAAVLLSACIGSVDPAYPLLRLLDTLIGATIAIVFGYLLWPGRVDLESSMGLGAAVAAAGDYLAAVDGGSAVPQVRDRAYATAHHARDTAAAALLEPPPISGLAGRALPDAIAVEDLVDEITAAAAGPTPDHARLARLRAELADVSVSAVRR